MKEFAASVTPLFIDIVIAAIILVVALLRAKAGLAHCVLSVAIIFIALIVGIAGGRILSGPISDKVWESYGPKVEARFDAQAEQAKNGEKTLEEVFRENWNRIIDSFELEELESLKIKSGDIDYSDGGLVAKFRVLTLAKTKLILENACRLIVSGLLTAIMLFVLVFLKNKIEKILDKTPIGWINHLGGFILGLAEAVVVITVVVRGASLLNIRFFYELSEGTRLLNWFVGGDVQQTINSIQSLSLEDVKNLDPEKLKDIDISHVGERLRELIEELNLGEKAAQAGAKVKGLIE